MRPGKHRLQTAVLGADGLGPACDLCRGPAVGGGGHSGGNNESNNNWHHHHSRRQLAPASGPAMGPPVAGWSGPPRAGAAGVAGTPLGEEAGPLCRSANCPRAAQLRSCAGLASASSCSCTDPASGSGSTGGSGGREQGQGISILNCKSAMGGGFLQFEIEILLSISLGFSSDSHLGRSIGFHAALVLVTRFRILNYKNPQ